MNNNANWQDNYRQELRTAFYEYLKAFDALKACDDHFLPRVLSHFTGKRDELELNFYEKQNALLTLARKNLHEQGE